MGAARAEPRKQHDSRRQQKGDEITLAWEVVDNHVRENADIQIRLWSEGKYHGHGEWDDYFFVHCHVLSPLVGESPDLPDELTAE